MSMIDSFVQDPRMSDGQGIPLPISFKTLAIGQAGGAVIVQEKTIDFLREDEVLIRVDYASINRMDPMLAKVNSFNFSPPYVLGFDFSGEVVKVGSVDENGPDLGAQVFGRTILGGCFAEYVVAQKQHVAYRGGIPSLEACTYGIAYVTAYESLVISGNIGRYAGKWIYVAGAAGGVGHFAAQIAKSLGLMVIGSAGKAASIDLLHRLGLAKVIDYSKQDVVHEIMDLTGSRGVEVVYDSTFAQCSYVQSSSVVASGGEYIRLGTPTQLARVGAEDMTASVEGRGGRMVVGDLGRYRVDPDYQSQIPKLADGLRNALVFYKEGKVKPVITMTIPFEAKALQQVFQSFMEGISNVGKVVVRCWD